MGPDGSGEPSHGTIFRAGVISFPPGIRPGPNASVTHRLPDPFTGSRRPAVRPFRQKGGKRMFGRGRIRWGILLALAAGLTGCGGGAGKPVKVNGLVTLDKKPLAGATILFLPAKESGKSANGLT